MSALPKYPIAVILLIWLAGLGAAAQFGKLAVAFGALRQIYDVSEVWLGFLMSSVGVVGLVFGVVGGVIVDRIGLRKMLLLGLLVSGFISLLQSLMPVYPVLLASRFVEGIAHLVIVVAAPVLVAQYASDRLRPAFMTLWGAFFGVSYAVIAVIAGPVIARFGVGGLIFGHGIYMLILALILLAVLPTAPRQRDQPPRLSIKDWVTVHVQIYRSPWLSAAALGFVWYTMMYIALLAYLPDFMTPKEAAVASGLMPLLSIVVSLTLGVWMLSRMGGVRVVIWGFALMGVAGFLVLVAPASLFWAALVITGISGIIPSGSFSSLSELNTSETDRAYAMGAMAQMGNVGTTCGAPLLAALLVTRNPTAFAIFIALCSAIGICVVAWLRIRRSRS
ncbi:MFS transporter [Algirhabdus cladophorae]|uniref:MFS transporter n=1 Tax=Algirhabdus cladophorae TaxID=3377108 RepID=UPI003B84927E